MRAAIRSSLAAALLLAPPSVAQDPGATLEGTLAKQTATLAQLLTGRFANAEQAAFADALTPVGEPAFKTDYELVIDDALNVKSIKGALIADGGITITLGATALNINITSDTVDCKGVAEPVLDGFEIRFEGRQKRCPFAPKMTVLPGGIHLSMAKSRPALQLARARDFSCWVSIPRGDNSWFFKTNIPIHDQGGWAWVDTDETPPQRVGLKMRNAVWPYGRSRPSLVLYVYKPDDLDRAASYAWAEPNAVRLGINLRWMQGSCTASGT